MFPKAKVKRKLNLSVLDVDTTEDVRGDAEERSKDAAASRTESVAKGVFVFKGSQGSSGRVRRDDLGRSEYHAAAIANADESFARLRSDMFADVVDAVVGFVERSKTTTGTQFKHEKLALGFTIKKGLGSASVIFLFLLHFELFLSVGNIKPKLELFFNI